MAANDDINLKDVKVGDTLYLVDQYRSSVPYRTVEATKIGRKYVHAGYGGEYSIESGQAKGGYGLRAFTAEGLARKEKRKQALLDVQKLGWVANQHHGPRQDWTTEQLVALVESMRSILGIEG